MSGRIDGGKSDAAAQRGQACRVAGHNGAILEVDVRAELLGAEDYVKNLHFEMGAGPLTWI